MTFIAKVRSGKVSRESLVPYRERAGCNVVVMREAGVLGSVKKGGAFLCS